MKKEKTTMCSKALDYIKSQIAIGTWKTGAKLPNYRTIARAAKVGHLSMLNAIAILKKEKKLCVKKGIGIFVGSIVPESDLPEAAQPKERKWEQVKNRLKQAVLEGDFLDQGVLPSSKELLNTYGVDMRTMQKALQSLVTEKLLEPHKRRYRMCAHSLGTTRKSIFLIMSESFYNYELWSISKKYFDEFVQGIEKECAIRGVRLFMLPYKPEILGTLDTKGVLGYIVWHSKELNLLIEPLARDLHRSGQPVAICQYLDAATWVHMRNIEIYSQKPRFFVSAPTMYKTAGLQMGHFLLQKGHTNVCFLNATGGNITDDHLYNGLDEAFATPNHTNSVHRLVLNDLTEDERHLLINNKDAELESSVQKELNVLDECRNAITSSIERPLSNRLFYEIMEARFLRNAHTFLTPIFRKALAIKDVTAWILLSDDMAIYGACKFLKGEGIKVPAEIGVVGLADFSDSRTNNLTTYHFDYAGAAKKMVAMIMYPEYAKKTFCIKGTNMFEIEGMVIDRGSA